MKKSRWIIASVAIAGMMGFGHAGCYTSGIPGGTGFGGAMSMGGGPSSSSLGGSAAGGDDGGTAEDAGPDAAVAECANSFDCQEGQVCANRQCVDCGQDADCIVDPSKTHCDMTSNTCVECLPTAGCDTDQRCVSNQCIVKISCSSDVACTSLQPKQICGPGYCVECTTAVPCKDFNPVKCGDGSCTCPDGLCLDSSGARVTQVQVPPGDAG